MIFQTLHRLAFALGLVSVAGSLAGCKQAVRSSTEQQSELGKLPYPMMVVYESGQFQRLHSPTEFQAISLPMVLNETTTPYLIDNELKLFRLEQFASTKGAVAMTASAGLGKTDVRFRMLPIRDENREQAKQLLKGVIAEDLSPAIMETTLLQLQQAASLEEFFADDSHADALAP